MFNCSVKIIQLQKCVSKAVMIERVFRLKLYRFFKGIDRTKFVFKLDIKMTKLIINVRIIRLKDGK